MYLFTYLSCFKYTPSIDIYKNNDVIFLENKATLPRKSFPTSAICKALKLFCLKTFSPITST